MKRSPGHGPGGGFGVGKHKLLTVRVAGDEALLTFVLRINALNDKHTLMLKLPALGGKTGALCVDLSG